MGNMKVTLYLLYLGVNIYEKNFYQAYKFIILCYCVRTVTSNY